MVADVKHPDCEDRCQLKEHKGYVQCDLSGYCHLDPLPFDRLDEELNPKEKDDAERSN